MDWNAFDFSKDESFNAANDEIAQEALDVDTFFKSIDGTAGQGEAEENVSEEEVRASLLTLPSTHFIIACSCVQYFRDHLTITYRIPLKVQLQLSGNR